MKDEIKEILESLDKISKAEYYPEDLLTYKECRLLLDYITNLQEENEKEHYLVDKLTRQLNDEYKNTEYQCKQKEDYKSRCEKAGDMIEFIAYNSERPLTMTELNKVYYILQGSDKDE